MKIAILQCDTVQQKFQAEFGHYSTMIQQMFLDIGADFTFNVYDCQKGELPVKLENYDFFITTGSKSSVYEDEPWIRSLINFIRQLNAQNKKLIGICFGHQLIAMAFDGLVEKSERGWGVGIAHNRVINYPNWMRKKNTQLNILVSHQDQITVLPDDTKIIAESDFCPYFVVQWGENFLSIQGHPEWNHNYSRTLINDRRDRIPKKRVEVALDSLDGQVDNALFVNWIVDFVQHSGAKKT